MKTRRRFTARIMGNFLTTFLSPLAGGSIAFSLPIADQNLKILLTALISALIVTGIVIAKELDKYGNRQQTSS